MLNRLKNYSVLLSIASLMLLILQTPGVQVVPNEYNTIVNSVLSILVGLGIISSPDTSKNFKGYNFGSDE